MVTRSPSRRRAPAPITSTRSARTTAGSGYSARCCRSSRYSCATPRRSTWRAKRIAPARRPGKYACNSTGSCTPSGSAGGASSRTLVDLRRRQRQPGDRDALVDQLVVLLLAGKPADRACRSFFVVDGARFGRKLPADVFAFREQLGEHTRIKDLRDRERILAFHVGGLLRLGLGLRCAAIHPRRRGHPLDVGRAAGRTAEQPPFLLRGEVLGRAEPALESVATATKQIENNHLRILQCRHDRRPDRGQMDRPLCRGVLALQGGPRRSLRDPFREPVAQP